MIETEFLWLTVNLHFGVVPGKSSIFQERRDGEHEEVAIYTVDQRIPNVRELWEQLRCEAIRGYQVRGKILFSP